jgi:two-component sensor histidine kinase
MQKHPAEPINDNVVPDGRSPGADRFKGSRAGAGGIDRESAKDGPSSRPVDSGLGRNLVRALSNTGITVICQDRDLNVVWAQNVPQSWRNGDILGLSDADFLPTADTDRIVALKRAVLADGAARRLEMRQSVDAASRWYDVWLDADRDPGGELVGVVMTLVETTEHKLREQTLRTLLREVSHRSKNLLAVIQSIATQTGRYSGTIDVFLERFRGRLQSLASSQDIVTSTNWRGARLSQLIAEQAGRYCDDPSYSIRLDGFDPHLTPNATLHIGLALHELIVNSMSHGALSRPNGYVDLVVRLTKNPTDATREFTLLWSEKTQLKDATIAKRFGSVALERVVPASLDGEASLEIDNDRVEYRLQVPQANFDMD